MIAGAYTVHHGRYLVAHCGHAHEELGGGPHGYLSLIAPLVGCLVAMAALRLALHLVRRHSAAEPSRLALWLTTSVTLAVSYGLAEGLEDYLDATHRAGLSGALGHGGFTALLIAAAAAAVLTVLYKASAHVIRRIAKALRRRRRPRRAYRAQISRRATLARLPAFVCLSLYAGRGPPVPAA
jgi:hypothetical protein